MTRKQEIIDDIRICSKCLKPKIAHMDFYMCQGRYRYECKRCTIKRNVRYQRDVQSWKHRFASADEKKTYMQTYYAANKEKFAEYRRKFKEKHPDYHKDYARMRKAEKNERRD